MFSPVGNKKILLQIKRAKDAGYEDPLGMVMERMGRGSPEKDSEAGSDYDGSPSKRSKKAGDGANMTTAKIDKLLEDKGKEGVVMKKLLDATVRYNPETDKITLKQFQNKEIDHDLMRDIINKAFWLTFTDVEFSTFLDIFDPKDNGVVDGYQFMITFIRLGAVRKDIVAEKTRKKQAEFEVKKSDAELQKKLELERKNDVAADFDFDNTTRDAALRKLAVAAKKFDPARAPSLDAFNGKFMSAAVLREMLKRVFNLKVTSKELGAILKNFEDKDAAEKADKDAEMLKSKIQGADGSIDVNVAALQNDGDLAQALQGPSQISCNAFLRQFFRMGFDARDGSARDQRARQVELNKIAEVEKKEKLEASEKKMNLAIDFDFSELDIARADEKLLRCSTNYDRNAPGCQSLEGFDCEALSAGAFSDLVRRTFGLKLGNKELGYVIRKFDKKGKGFITCKPFLTAFLRMGQEERDRLRLKQLEKQRRMDDAAAKESEQKIKAIQENSSKFSINFDFTETDLDSAREKLTEASIWFDQSRGGSLASFEQKHLSPLEFSKALKRTFNINMKPGELGAIVANLDKDGEGKINSKEFINSFMALGFEARGSKQIAQIKASKDAEKKMREEAEAKRLALLNKSDVEIDYNLTDEERDAALTKMSQSAMRYDKSHPSAQSLDGFQCKELSPVAFKDLVRRTFNLRLSAKECGALVTHFDVSGRKVVNCQEFLTVFLQLGYQQRAQMSKEQLDRQRAEDKERQEHDAAMLKKTTERGGGLKINMDFAEEDAVSAQAKLLKSAEGYDKNHPAAPSLDAFDIAFMSPGIFRENMKRCFGIKLNPSELGYCVATYGNKKDMTIRSPEFLTKFLRDGKKIRYEKQSEALVKQRRLIKEANEEKERILLEQAEGSAFKVDLDDCGEADLESAINKMKQASEKFHEHTSTLKGFTGGPMKPGEFRELVRRSFNMGLNPRETAALVNEFNFVKTDKKGDMIKSDSIDSKLFLIKFMKLGHQSRNEAKNATMENQRRAEAFAAKEKIRKKRLADQKITTDIDWDYGEVDRTSVYEKLTSSSAKYDKNAPGCVSLVAFDALFLTPVIFREVMKRTFNIKTTPKELAVLISDFDNGNGNLHCQNFIVTFMKLGIDERNKFKLIMLEKQSRDNERRKTEHARKMREAEEKMSLAVSYDFTEDEKVEAFKKLSAAAKRYDRNAPGCHGLEGFEQKHLSAGTFREMVKRTFGLVPNTGELGAIMCYFDKEKSGMVSSQEFLVHFLKVGAAERNKDKVASLKKIRDDAEERQKVQEDLLAAQWRKTEINVDQKYSDKDRDSALEKLTEAASKFDPSAAGPVGPVAFQAKFLTAAVFREMLKRTFGMKINDRELASLIDEYEHEDEPKCIDCKVFMVEFNKLGIKARRAKTIGNVHKNRDAIKEAKEHHAKVKAAGEEKMASVVDFKYDKKDFNSALEKIREVAGNFERGHASSPSMKGFQGASMKPFEFKDMLMRTFAVPLTSKELGALTKFFDTTGSKNIDSSEFLAHFNKVNRQEAEIKRKKQIEKEKMIRTAATIKEADYQATLAEEEAMKTKFTKADEQSFLSKLRSAAQQYAVDSAALQEPLQAFKGPALNGVSFIDIFRRIFHGIKFTFAEYGVLLSILDSSGTRCIDGPKFLNWFYKIGRKETLIMLGEAEDDINLDSLKAGNTVDVTKGVESVMTPFNGKKSKSAKASKKFNEDTLDKSWVLPAAAEEDMGDEEVVETGFLESKISTPASSSSAPKGGKKLALMLMSEDGHKVGGRPNKGADDSLGLKNTGLITPTLPGGKPMSMSKSKSMGKVPSTKRAPVNTMKSSVKHKEVHIEKNPHTGKNSISIQAVGPTAADSAGFFFPTLIAGGGQPALTMPDIGISGQSSASKGGDDFF